MQYLRYLLILLIVPFIVLAEECDVSNITITSMKSNKIEGNTEVISDPTFEDRTIKLNLKMYDVGDSISYDMIIKNDSEEDYMIDEDTFKTDSDYIEYTLKTKDNTNVVKAKNSKEVSLIVTYKKEIEDDKLTNNKFNASNSLKLSLNTSEKEQPLDIITTDNIKESLDPKEVKNPVTSVSSMLLISLTLLTSIVILYILIKRKSRYSKYIILVLSMLLIPTVYAVCKCDIEVESTIEIEKKIKLFNTVSNLSKEDNACVTKYEGQVTDEVDKTVNASNVYFDKCLEKRNVIFGGFCWQIVRTTETKGTKLIYNGEPIDGKCESTRGESLGIIEDFNKITLNNLNNNYLYGDSFTYDISNNNFKLIDTTTAKWSDSTYENLLGKFTCKTTSDTCTVMYYISSYKSNNEATASQFKIDNNNYASIGYVSYNVSSNSPSLIGYMYNKSYYINTKNTEKGTPDSNATYVYGDRYVANSDGTFSIISPSAFYGSNWASNYQNIENKYICKNPINNKCNELWLVYQSFPSEFSFFRSTLPYKFANSFVYQNGVYTLGENSITEWNLADENFYNLLNNYNYTCWNTSGTCSTISYVYNFRSPTLYYINLKDGNSATNALNEMINDDNINKKNSILKGTIDAWYLNYLSEKADYLEDTVYCSARNITDYGLWKQNNIIGEYPALRFKTYNVTPGATNLSKNLDCENITDQFAVSNNKAKLKYPVATLTIEEASNLGNEELLKTLDWYWTMSPSFYDTDYAGINLIDHDGAVFSYFSYLPMNVRPMISLKYHNYIISGTGSESDPWIIE